MLGSGFEDVFRLDAQTLIPLTVNARYETEDQLHRHVCSLLEEAVAHAWKDVELRARYPLREEATVTRREEPVAVPSEDQRRDLQLRKPVPGIE